jgi:hypothetical protein
LPRGAPILSEVREGYRPLFNGVSGERDSNCIAAKTAG